MSDRSRVVTSGRFMTYESGSVTAGEKGRNPEMQDHLTMAVSRFISPAGQGLTPVIWQSDFWVEYLHENQFGVAFGTTLDAMIRFELI